jgi:cysteine desulfurase
VLLAMGVDPASARGSLRLSFGHTSTEADVDAALAVLPAAVERARQAALASAGAAEQ